MSFDVLEVVLDGPLWHMDKLCINNRACDQRQTGVPHRLEILFLQLPYNNYVAVKG